jgi:hypothetical protein
MADSAGFDSEADLSGRRIEKRALDQFKFSGRGYLKEKSKWSWRKEGTSSSAAEGGVTLRGWRFHRFNELVAGKKI